MIQNILQNYRGENTRVGILLLRSSPMQLVSCGTRPSTLLVREDNTDSTTPLRFAQIFLPLTSHITLEKVTEKENFVESRPLYAMAGSVAYFSSQIIPVLERSIRILSGGKIDEGKLSVANQPQFFLVCLDSSFNLPDL
jgi:hypothetical protein